MFLHRCPMCAAYKTLRRRRSTRRFAKVTVLVYTREDHRMSSRQKLTQRLSNPTALLLPREYHASGVDPIQTTIPTQKSPHTTTNPILHNPPNHTHQTITKHTISPHKNATYPTPSTPPRQPPASASYPQPHAVPSLTLRTWGRQAPLWAFVYVNMFLGYVEGFVGVFRDM